MYFILNSYGDPNSDYLQVCFSACERAWSMTMIFRLHGKTYAYADCANEQYPIHDEEFWYKVFFQGFGVLATDVKADYPVIDVEAFRDQCMAKIKPEQFERSKWCYVNALSHVVDEEEDGEAKED